MSTINTSDNIVKNIDERFFSLMVTPINDIEKGKEEGHYDYDYEYDNCGFRKSIYKYISLQGAKDVKRIYFIPVTERIHVGKEVEYLAKFGKKPVTHAPNYLLGVLAQCKQKDLPEELKSKDIVAVPTEEFDVVYRENLITEPAEESELLYPDNPPCILHCYQGDGGRGLNWMSWVYPWDTDDNRVFLAEDIEEK